MSLRDTEHGKVLIGSRAWLATPPCWAARVRHLIRYVFHAQESNYESRTTSVKKVGI